MTSKLGFGVGQVAEGICLVVFNTFTLFFYNQIIGVSASLTGMALAIALIFDAVSDPLAGSISDNFQSKWGRRHPFMAGSCIPLALAIFGLFNPPENMSEIFYFGWLLLFAISARLFLTLYHVPHMALGAEMADDYADRTRVYSYSQFFGTVGSAGFAFLAYTFFFPTTDEHSHGMLNEAGYLPFSGTAGIGIVVTILACVWYTRREIPHMSTWKPREESLSTRRLWREIKTALSIRSYSMLLCGLLCAMVIIGVEHTFMVYIYIHFWELGTESMRWLSPMQLAGLPLSVLMAPYLLRWFDKRTILIVFAALIIINMNVLILLRLFTDVLPVNGDPILFYLLLTVAFIAGLISPALMINFNSMFADVADELDLLTGNRQEGIIFSARSFSLKASGAIATMIAGIALDLIGFPKGAAAGTVPPDIVYRLGLVAGPTTIVLGLANLSFFIAYRLDRKRMEEVKQALNARRTAEAAP
ncbi:MAG: MFS transporter [Gammaproteobacteria bacterium]|jgi:glycoside/pentoside/hexuronide:cation symporter, GPH family|nr:MFS transporter [Gammaproteobacteria bacterium]